MKYGVHRNSFDSNEYVQQKSTCAHVHACVLTMRWLIDRSPSSTNLSSTAALPHSMSTSALTQQQQQHAKSNTSMALLPDPGSSLDWSNLVTAATKALHGTGTWQSRHRCYHGAPRYVTTPRVFHIV